MMRRHYFTLLCFLLAAHVTGCRTTPRPDERPNASVVPPAVWPTPDSARPAPTRPHNVANPAAGWPEASLPNRLTDAIGLSTPEGRERRQAVRMARASVPRKLGKGAVYAPQARQVVAAYKPQAAVVLADSGATVTAIDKVKAPLAIGAGATATQAIEKKGFWGTVASGLSLWWLLIPVGYGAWWLYRKTLPFA